MPRIVMKGRSDMGGGFEVWPKGRYNGVITKVEQGTAKASKNPQVIISVKVIDGPYADKSTRMWFTISPNSIFRIEELLAATIPGEYDVIALEEKDPEGHPLQEINFDTDALIDRQFSFDCFIKADDKGEERNDFKKFSPLDGSAPANDAAAGSEEQAAAEAPPAATPPVARARTRQVTT
jgi:Protein of unknown function (DUF669)